MPRLLPALVPLVLALSLSLGLGAVFTPTDAERVAAAAVLAASTAADRIAAFQKLLKVKDARIADVTASRDELRKTAEDAAREFDAVQRAAALEAHDALSAKAAKHINCSIALHASQTELAATKTALDTALDEAHNPHLSIWAKERFADFSSLAGDEGGGRLLAESMSQYIIDGQRGMDFFSVQMQQKTGFGRFVAAFMCAFAITTPMYVLLYLLSRITKAISFKQHVLISHIFNVCLVLVLSGVIILTGDDPLPMIFRERALRFTFNLFFIIQWSFTTAIIMHTITITRGKERLLGFAHIAGYCALAAHARLFSYAGVMHVLEAGGKSGQNLRFYLGYAVALTGFSGIIAMASEAEGKDSKLVGEVAKAFEGGMSVAGITSNPKAPLGQERRFRSSTSSSSLVSPSKSMVVLPNTSSGLFGLEKKSES